MGAQHGVHGTGRGFYRDAVGVAQAVGHAVELTGVGDQAGGRPPTAGIGAEAGLEAGPDVAEGECPQFPTWPPGRPDTGADAPGHAPEHRLEDNPGAGGQG